MIKIGEFNLSIIAVYDLQPTNTKLNQEFLESEELMK